jgi:Restriction endonuclease S subunits
VSKWETVRLGDVATVQAGGTPSRTNQEYWKNGTIPWVKISDFNGKRLSRTEEFITEKGLQNSSTKLFPADTILFTIFATLGEVSVLNIEAATNQAIAGITIIDDGLDPNYLVFYLKSIKRKILETGRGVAQNNINLSILRGLEIPLPPLETQQKIADVLDRAGALIEKRKAQIEKLDLLIKSQFIEMFGDPLIQNPKWDFKRLGDITTVVSGSTPKTNVDKFWDGILKWITPAELSNNTFYVMDSERHITELGAQDLGLKPFPAGTVILSSRAPIGKVAIAGTEMYCNQGFKNLICSESISPIYLFWMLKQKTVYLNSLGRGATFKEISKKIVEDIKISIPPLVLQTQFADFVSQVEAQKSLLQQSLEKLEINYKSLMQKCFRGEIF